MVTIFLLISIISALFSNQSPAFCAEAKKFGPVKAAYFYYGSGYDPSAIDATPLTHVFYAFALLNPNNFSISPALGDNGKMQTFSSTLKNSNPCLKTLISIGGAGSDANAFSAMAASSSNRASFVSSSIALARDYGFDGLDLNWEFPQSDSDMTNLGTLFREWRQATLVENRSSPLLLSAAVKYNVTVMFGGAGTYPAAIMSQYLDFVGLMEFDLHGSWESVTGIHTAIRSSDPSDVLTADYGIEQWLNAGLSASRALLGMAMYGRTWMLQNPSTDNGIGASATGAGPNAGVLTYDEIQQFKMESRAICQDDSVTMASYCYGATATGTTWVGYDETTAITMKVNYLKRKGLRGYFFWNLASDRNGTLSNQASITLAESKTGDKFCR